MDQMNSLAMSMLQTMASATELPKTGKGEDGEAGDFQKLLEEKSQEKDPLLEEPPKAAAKPAAAPKKEAPAQKKAEDPVEASKQLQVYLAPLTPEELSQYPAEWLPQVEEGEPIVCIGVTTGENGQQVPILVGANTAEQMYGKPMVAPEAMDPSDPEADAMLEATDPTVEHGPAELLEEAVDEQAGKVMQQAMEEARPQRTDDDTEMEVTDVEQAPQRVFHDVEAAPVKVGEVENPQRAEEPDVAQQVDAQLIQAMEKGESMVRVQLTPENLGEVTVEISQSAQGALRVALTAHSTETRSLLERHAGELQGMLSSRTQQSVEVEVQRGQEGQQNQNQQHSYDGHSGHAQDGQQERRQRREHTSSQDFMQQLRLGLIPADGEF